MLLGLMFGDVFWTFEAGTRWMYQAVCIGYYTFIAALSVLGILGAPNWLTLRDLWGFKDKTQQFLFVLLPFGGTWVFVIGRMLWGTNTHANPECADFYVPTPFGL